jgi:hypothetical protein
MTSEIAVMNQRAIAFAADSAVTLIDGGRVIVRNDQKKLFNLAAGEPVGVMFFGLADLMGHPWDVLVSQYRTPRPLAHVRDHAESLFRQLDGLESFFPKTRYRDEYRRLLASVFRFIFRFSHYLQENGAEGPDEAILGRAIELVWRRYQRYPDGRERRDLDCFPPGFAATIERDYGGVIADTIAYAFGAFPLDSASRERLTEIGTFCVVKDLFLEDVTGLVFGGYGAEDSYPAVATYHASAVVSGIVKRARIEETRIDGDMHAAISLYAESDASYAFLRGIDMELEAYVYGSFQATSHELVDRLLGSVGNMDPAERESLRRRFHAEEVPEAVQETYEAVNDYQQRAFIDPVLAVIQISTRQDLAETARALVDLNIFRKRITAQDPTVGGAIDVAVISREAGFTWWKRQGGAS